MKSLIDFFNNSVNQYPNNPLIWEKEEGVYKAHSYSEIKNDVYDLANVLLSLGLKDGDRAALLSEGRKHWLVSELAVLHCGAINVPLSTKLEADRDLFFRINHSEAKILIVSKNQLPKIRLVKKEFTSVETIIVLDDIELEEKEVTISSLLQNKETLKEKYNNELKERISKVTPDSYANISYTSGTTADPKGIILSHRNYTANVEQAFSFIEIPQSYKTLVVLPWDHAFAHTAALYSFMHKGASIASVQIGKNQIETLKNFSNNMLEIQPDILMSVPAMAKNFKKGIENGIAAKGAVANSLFKAGIKFAYWYNGTGDNKGAGLKFLTKPIYSFFNKIIFSKIKVKFGGKLKYFIGGGALLDIDLQRFFYAIGIPMYQGYGLTEASPIISANTPLYHKMGTSGKVVNDLEIKICDSDGNELPLGEKGEIVIKGENTMKGYWKNEEATKEALKEGWLYTGDMGYLAEDNYLYVLGRFKSLLISADGEKYSPEGIEEAIIDHCPYIDQIVLHNDHNPYTIGLIVLNSDAIKTFAKKQHKDITNPDDLDAILEELDKDLKHLRSGKNTENTFPARWFPSAFGILPEALREQNKLVNSTMKVVRGKVTEYFSKEVEYLYTPAGKNLNNSKNKENLSIFLKSFK